MITTVVDLEVKFSKSVRNDKALLAKLRGDIALALQAIWDPKGKVNKI